MPAVLQRHTGQLTGGEGGGVNINPVRQDFRPLDRRVPVHNDFSEIHVAAQKLTADPEQIAFVLPIERQARPHSGMTQKIFTVADRVSQRLQKLDMRGRQRRTELARRLVIGSPEHQPADRHAIGMHRLQATQPAPMRAGRRIGKESGQKLLVISLERDVGRWKWIDCKTVEHATRLRSAVYIVAQRDGQRIRPVLRDIALDRGDGALEQIQPAVDIADRINPSIFVWNARISVLGGAVYGIATPLQCRTELHERL